MLEEKVVRRGEVWWISAGNSTGSEISMGRPGVIVSGDSWNEREPTVSVVYVTSKPSKSQPITPKIDWGEGLRRAVCNHIYTVDKSRLDRKCGELEQSEMVRIAGALAVYMQIPQYQHTAKSQSEPKIEGNNDDVIASMRCEIDMWRRMYEKTMEQLVELRVDTAIARLTDRAMEPVLEPVVPEPEKPVVKSALVEPDLGFEEEPENLEPKKPEPKQKPKKSRKKKEASWDGVKVNVNTVKTATELKKKTGMAMHTAAEIVKTRKIVGKYDKLDDLLALDHFGEKSMARYGHMLEV